MRRRVFVESVDGGAIAPPPGGFPSPPSSSHLCSRPVVLTVVPGSAEPFPGRRERLNALGLGFDPAIDCDFDDLLGVVSEALVNEIEHVPHLGSEINLHCPDSWDVWLSFEMRIDGLANHITSAASSLCTDICVDGLDQALL